MTTSIAALGISVLVVLGLVLSLAGLSLLIGAIDRYFGGPSINYLRSEKEDGGFGFALNWNSAKEPASIDFIKLRLFNPKGSPTQVEVSQSFKVHKGSFVEDVEFGPGLVSFFAAKGFETARVLVEVGSSKDGLDFQFEYSGEKFKSLISSINQSVSEFEQKHNFEASSSKSPVTIPERKFIADSVMGSHSYLKLATNPLFADKFTAPAGEAGGKAASGEELPNFSVSKVWIDPGCIICNACEDIYPEVFDVQADTCYIRPNAPLDNGLRIQEASDACPVEVIKFTAA